MKKNSEQYDNYDRDISKKRGHRELSVPDNPARASVIIEFPEVILKKMRRRMRT